MKSKTCYGRKTREPLTEYRNAMDARQATNYVSDRKMVAYECNKCGWWHLSPADRQTPSAYCDYCGKELYETKQAVQRRAKILLEERGVRLSIYQCEYSDGWHLTSQ